MAESVQTSMTTMERMRNDAKRFAADVSHELRTPLSTLTAVVEVLATTTDGMEPDARESAQLAITETHRLVNLVEDLMGISQFDAGTAQLRLEEFDVADAVHRCLRARRQCPAPRCATRPRARLHVRRQGVRRGDRPQPRALRRGLAARIRSLLQGRHRARPYPWQRARLGDRQGEPPRARRRPRRVRHHGRRRPLCPRAAPGIRRPGETSSSIGRLLAARGLRREPGRADTRR